MFNRGPKIFTDAARENKGQFFFHSSVTCFPSASSYCQTFLCHFCLHRKTVGCFHLPKSQTPNSQISKCQIPPLLNFLPVSCYHIPSFNPPQAIPAYRKLIPHFCPCLSTPGLASVLSFVSGGCPKQWSACNKTSWKPKGVATWDIYPAAQRHWSCCVLLPSNKHKPIKIF